MKIAQMCGSKTASYFRQLSKQFPRLYSTRRRINKDDQGTRDGCETETKSILQSVMETDIIL